MFGTTNTEKLLTVFGGTTLHIPSTKEIEEEERNLGIYQTLMGAKSSEESKRLGKLLCEHHHLTLSEMRVLLKITKKKFKEATKRSEVDKQVGKHFPKKIKMRRRNKRGM